MNPLFLCLIKVYMILFYLKNWLSLLWFIYVLKEQRLPNINFSGLKWSNSGRVLTSQLGILAITILLATLL